MQLPRILRPGPRPPRDCTCGHLARAHEHYRKGSDCALCPCAKFRPGAVARPRDERDTYGELRAARAA